MNKSKSTVHFVNRGRFVYRAIVSSLLGSTAAAGFTISANAAESAALKLEEVIVTAQRRFESVQDIGASITAADTRELTKLNVTNVTDLELTTPGLSIETPFGEGGAPVFTIRGAATADPFSLNQSRPVALNIDDATRSLGALEITPIYDIERVEVLKGPQGSLYGRNAVGGAVNVISKRPDFETDGYLTLGAGNYNRLDVRGAAQTGLVDELLAARIAFTKTKYDGYVDNKIGKDTDNGDIESARLSFLLTPSESFEALLRIYHTEIENDGYSALAEDGSDVWGPAASRDGLSYDEERSDLDSFGEAVNKGLNLQLTYETEALTFTSITTYDEGEWITRNDDDHTSLDFLDDTYAIDDIEQFSQEFRVRSNSDGDFHWLAGVSYGEDRSTTSHTFMIFNDPIVNPDPGFSMNNFAFNYGNRFDQDRETYAAYARTDYDFTEDLNAYFGIRYTEDTVEVSDMDVFQDFGVVGAFGSPGVDFGTFAPLVDLSEKVTSDNVSVEVGATYQISEELMAYASFKQGYRGPAINAQVFFFADELTTVDPEEVDAYEVGIKWDVSARLRVNAALFHNDYTDLQTLNTIPGVTPNSFLLALVNAAESRASGIEWDITGLLTESLSVNFAGAWLDTEYEEFIANGIDVSGNQPLFTTELSASLGINWNIMDVDSGALSLYAAAHYQSESFYDAFESVARDDGHWLANARLAWESANKGWSAALWGKNLFDERYNTYGFDAEAFLGYSYNNRGVPRTFGAELTYHF